MTTKVATFPLRLQPRLRTSVTAMEPTCFLRLQQPRRLLQCRPRIFLERRNGLDRETLRRILNRKGGEEPVPEDRID